MEYIRDIKITIEIDTNKKTTKMLFYTVEEGIEALEKIKQEEGTDEIK